MRPIQLVLACAFCMAMWSRSLAQTSTDLGFETGKVGDAPKGWAVPVEGWKAGLTEEKAATGTRAVNPFTLPGGYSVSWTGMKVLKHDGSQHHGVGIQPTVPVTPTARGIAEGRDEVLEKAIEVMKAKIAAAPGGS